MRRGLDGHAWIYNGHTFKHSKQGWGTLLKVTDHSMTLMYDKLLAEWLARPEQLRRKFNRKDMEDHAEMSALVAHIYHKTLHSTPLSASDMNDTFCQAYIDGTDHHLSLELSSIMSEKPSDIKVESLSCIKDLLIRHTGTHRPSQSTTVQLQQDLEADNFGIL